MLKKQNPINDLSTVILRRPYLCFRDGSKPLTRWVQPLKWSSILVSLNLHFRRHGCLSIAPVFLHYPVFDLVSVAMIVFEIALGIALFIGVQTQTLCLAVSSTGCVFYDSYRFYLSHRLCSRGVNFFDFGNWGAYKASNMKGNRLWLFRRLYQTGT